MMIRNKERQKRLRERGQDREEKGWMGEGLGDRNKRDWKKKKTKEAGEGGSESRRCEKLSLLSILASPCFFILLLRVSFTRYTTLLLLWLKAWFEG